MYKKSASGQKFKVKWEIQRQNKMKYILIYGVLLRSVLFANTLYWLFMFMQKMEFSWVMYGATYLIGGLFGLVSGFREFRAKEKQYQQILDWEREEEAPS